MKTDTRSDAELVADVTEAQQYARSILAAALKDPKWQARIAALRISDRRALPLDGPDIGADVPGGGAI